MSQELLDKAAKWYVLKEKLAQVKAQEAALRREICEEVLQGQLARTKMTVGTAEIIATPSLNYKVDEATYNSIFKGLSDQEIAAVKVKYEIKKREFKALPIDCLLADAVTIKEGMPKLEIKEVK